MLNTSLASALHQRLLILEDGGENDGRPERELMFSCEESFEKTNPGITTIVIDSEEKNSEQEAESKRLIDDFFEALNLDKFQIGAKGDHVSNLFNYFLFVAYSF